MFFHSVKWSVFNIETCWYFKVYLDVTIPVVRSSGYGFPERQQISVNWWERRSWHFKEVYRGWHNRHWGESPTCTLVIIRRWHTEHLSVCPPATALGWVPFQLPRWLIGLVFWWHRTQKVSTWQKAHGSRSANALIPCPLILQKPVWSFGRFSWWHFLQASSTWHRPQSYTWPGLSGISDLILRPGVTKVFTLWPCLLFHFPAGIWYEGKNLSWPWQSLHWRSSKRASWGIPFSAYVESARNSIIGTMIAVAAISTMWPDRPIAPLHLKTYCGYKSMLVNIIDV